MYQQLVSPNLSAVGRITYCLEYASRLVFQNPAAGTTAWNAWLVCNQHKDQNFPPGVSFPVWFSGAGGDGHVAVFTPNGIYSSPYNTSTGHAVLPSIAKVESTYGVKYVGWSEDILNLKVIGGSMATDSLSKEEIAAIYQLAFDNDDYPQDLINAYTGKPLDGYITQLLSDPSYKAHKQAVNNPVVPNATKLAPGLYQV